MAVTNTTSQTNIPQTTNISSQNYDLDVPLMYKHFVTGGATPNDNEPGENIGIDDIRGQISVTVTNTPTAALLASLNISPTSTTAATTPTTTVPVMQAQESRCHAFYRIIGFPVISSDKQTFYSPGFDRVMGPGITRTITPQDKITIAGKVGTAFETISQNREAYSSATATIFTVPQSVEAGVLALTSGTYGSNSNINIRKFAAPFLKNTSLSPFDFTAADQTYSAPVGDITAEYSLVGNQPVLLSNYMDNNANNPNVKAGNYSILQRHQHIIVPFMVDPRIDFSVWSSESKTVSGLSKRIAVPFVPNASYLNVSSTATAERPLIEKIITDRMSQTNNTASAGQAVSAVVQYIQNTKSIQSVNIGSTPIGNIFSNNIFKTSQQDAFANYFLIIQAMIKKLVASLGIIHAAQGAYYWLPIPSTKGPEGGCTIRPILLNQNVPATLIAVPNDSDLIFNQLQVLVSSLTTVSANANSTPDRGGFALPNQTITFDSSTSDSLGSHSSQTMDTLTSRRNRKLSDAGDALQVIEMIMGEFSGLGLCDIIAIVGSLYVMPLTSVLGLLDYDAYGRAKTALGSSLPSQDSIVISMNNMASYVNGFYQIMDQVFQDYIGNNANTQ